MGWHSLTEPFRTNIEPNIERSDAPCLYNFFHSFQVPRHPNLVSSGLSAPARDVRLCLLLVDVGMMVVIIYQPFELNPFTSFVVHQNNRAIYLKTAQRMYEYWACDL